MRDACARIELIACDIPFRRGSHQFSSLTSGPIQVKPKRIHCCTCHPGRSTKRSIFRLAAKVFVHSLVFNSFEFLRGPVTFLACRSFKFACCQSQFALRYLFGCSADTSSFTNPIRGGLHKNKTICQARFPDPRCLEPSTWRSRFPW